MLEFIDLFVIPPWTFLLFYYFITSTFKKEKKKKKDNFCFEHIQYSYNIYIQIKFC